MTELRTKPKVERGEGGVSFWIHATPRSKREKVAGLHGDALRVSVLAPPEDGKANAACAQLLARVLEVHRQAVELDPSSKSRRKRVRVQGDPAVLEQRLCALAAAASE